MKPIAISITPAHLNDAVQFQSTAYLVHAASFDTTLSSDAVFNLIVHRPRISGGILTIPIDSTVRLVKCFRSEARHNTIRLRYGKEQKCLIVRVFDSLERDKWLAGIIRAIAAAQNLENYVPISTYIYDWNEIESRST
ncbi:hypothetical protein CCR75_007569 [Bremia lactucae]|uniref:PH domain-containing protein n=1 Tax=Bremia lactucae TaxID=4779 RepID=A0A976IAU4_BRELC|nr:hypothetical protein CCR75_007569 [Bremia lactucae]